MPSISVLLPFYNAEKTSVSALRSLLRQSYREFEVVAVDGGSTDRGASLVLEMSRRDPRVRLIPGVKERPSEPAQRLCAALNQGLSRCEGEFLARMDAAGYFFLGSRRKTVVPTSYWAFPARMDSYRWCRCLVSVSTVISRSGYSLPKRKNSCAGM